MAVLQSISEFLAFGRGLFKVEVQGTSPLPTPLRTRRQSGRPVISDHRGRSWVSTIQLAIRLPIRTPTFTEKR